METLTLGQMLEAALGSSKAGVVDFEQLHNLLNGMLLHLGLRDLLVQANGEPLEGAERSPFSASFLAELMQKVEASEKQLAEMRALCQELREEVVEMKVEQSRMAEDMQRMQEAFGPDVLEELRNQLFESIMSALKEPAQGDQKDTLQAHPFDDGELMVIGNEITLVERSRTPLARHGDSQAVSPLFPKGKTQGRGKGLLDVNASSDSVSEGTADTRQTDTGRSDTGWNVGQKSVRRNVQWRDTGQKDMGQKDTGSDAQWRDKGQTDMGQKDMGQKDTGQKDMGQKDMGRDAQWRDKGQTDMGQTDMGQKDMGRDVQRRDMGQKDMGQKDMGQSDTGRDVQWRDMGQTDMGQRDRRWDMGRSDMGRDVQQRDIGQTDMGQKDMGQSDTGRDVKWRDTGQDDMGQDDMRHRTDRQDYMGQDDMKQKDMGQDDMGQDDMRQDDMGQDDMRHRTDRQDDIRQDDIRQDDMGHIKDEEVKIQISKAEALPSYQDAPPGVTDVGEIKDEEMRMSISEAPPHIQKGLDDDFTASAMHPGAPGTHPPVQQVQPGRPGSQTHWIPAESVAGTRSRPTTSKEARRRSSFRQEPFPAEDGLMLLKQSSSEHSSCDQLVKLLGQRSRFILSTPPPSPGLSGRVPRGRKQYKTQEHREPAVERYTRRSPLYCGGRHTTTFSVQPMEPLLPDPNKPGVVELVGKDGLLYRGRAP